MLPTGVITVSQALTAVLAMAVFGTRTPKA
jgi:hypothetical protein